MSVLNHWKSRFQQSFAIHVLNDGCNEVEYVRLDQDTFALGPPLSTNIIHTK